MRSGLAAHNEGLESARQTVTTNHCLDSGGHIEGRMLLPYRPAGGLVAHNHRFDPNHLLWPPLFSQLLTYLVVVGMIVVAAWWLWRPGGRLQILLLAIAVNRVVTEEMKDVLKWVFGRTWPETWKGNNPSLIADGVYGFHPFHSGAPTNRSRRAMRRPRSPWSRSSGSAGRGGDGFTRRWPAWFARPW